MNCLLLLDCCYGLPEFGYIAVLSNLKQPSLYFLTVGRFLSGRGIYKKAGTALGFFSCYKLISNFLTIVLVYCYGCLKG
jgi:hypothetical protein